MSKKRVLFVCVHNGGRSQMAEAFLNYIAPDRFEAESGGIEPGDLNPLAVEVMDEIDIDISRNMTKSVEELLVSGKTYDYVVTVCDGANAERCPFVPGVKETINWSFEDPAASVGKGDEGLQKVRQIRDQILEKIEAFCAGPLL